MGIENIINSLEIFSNSERFDVPPRPINKTFGMHGSSLDLFIKLYNPNENNKLFKSDYFSELTSYIVGMNIGIPLAPNAWYWDGVASDIPSPIMELVGKKTDTQWNGIFITQRIDGNPANDLTWDLIEELLVSNLNNPGYCKIVAFDQLIGNVDSRLNNIIFCGKENFSVAFDNERAFANCVDWSNLFEHKKSLIRTSVPSGENNKELYLEKVRPFARQIMHDFIAHRQTINNAIIAAIPIEWAQPAIDFLDYRAENLLEFITQSVK